MKKHPLLLSTLCMSLLLVASACSKQDVNPTPTARNGVADATILGPYTVAATLTRVQTNQRIFLAAQPGRALAAGIYICDVYLSSAQVTLSRGQLMIYDTDAGVSKPGYTTPTNNTVGSSSSQTGRTFTFNTYSVLPLFDVTGRRIGGDAFPRDLSGNTYTYQVYQP